MKSPELYYSCGGLRKINYTGRWKLQRAYHQDEPELFIEHEYESGSKDRFAWISEQNITEVWETIGSRESRE